MIQYYFHDGQKEQGPFDIEQLKSQTLKKDTPIWYEGLESWTTVGEVEELKQLFASKPTLPPLIKTIPEVKTTPPKIEQPSYGATNHQDTFPTKKKSLLVPLIISGVLIVGALIIWLVYQNNQHTNVIQDLQDTVSTKSTAEEDKEAERQRINQVNTVKNMNFRNNWENYIKVQNSEPTVDYTFGGISAFSVYVSNQTSYMLDQVDVYVQYIRKNGEVYQTKSVTILNVPAGSSANAEAPSSLNGVKVSCIVEKIVSKKMHFCYPENNGNPEDPYFCK
jgi:cell division protein FtsL